MIDLAFLKRLIETVESSDIDTLEISRWATKIRISKSPSVVMGGNAVGPVPMQVSAAHNAGGSPTPAAEEAEAPAAEPAEAPAAALHECRHYGAFRIGQVHNDEPDRLSRYTFQGQLFFK